MTQTLKNLSLVLLVAAGFALLALALAPAPGSATPAPAMHRIDAIPAAQAVPAPAPTPEASGLGTDYGIVTLALGEGVDYTQAQVDEVLAAADRVCEGITAQVPAAEMAQTLAAQEGMTVETAQAFVTLVSETRCGA